MVATRSCVERGIIESMDVHTLGPDTTHYQRIIIFCRHTGGRRRRLAFRAIYRTNVFVSKSNNILNIIIEKKKISKIKLRGHPVQSDAKTLLETFDRQTALLYPFGSSATLIFRLFVGKMNWFSAQQLCTYLYYNDSNAMYVRSCQKAECYNIIMRVGWHCDGVGEVEELYYYAEKVS